MIRALKNSISLSNIIDMVKLFRKKDNIVTSAKIFTEYELGSIVSTQPELKINQESFNKVNQSFS